MYSILQTFSRIYNRKEEDLGNQAIVKPRLSEQLCSQNSVLCSDK